MSRVVAGKVVEPTRVVGDETAAVVDDPVIMALDGPVLEAWEVEAAVVETALLKLMYDGEYVAVPLYAAQPGTVVFGGARPPPQSMKSQISPVPGTYHRTEASP